MIRIALFLSVLSGLVVACEGEEAGSPSPAETEVPPPDAVGACGETSTHAPPPREDDPCTQSGLVCGPYRCEGTKFKRIESCRTSPEEIGQPCKVEPGHPCALLGPCGGLPGQAAYRAYRCIDGRWKDVTSTPCPDAGTD